MSRLAGALTVAGAVALMISLGGGCGGSTAGSPVPGDTGATVADSSPPSAPARPRELRLDGKEPCGLVQQSDYPRFFIERPGKSSVNEVFNSPECFYSTNYGGFAVTLVVTEGVEAWTDGQRMGKSEDAAPVLGFPAVAVTLEGDENTCDVAVDVAPGQYLKAAVDVDPRMLPEVPQICEYAHQLAESAMKTLVGP